MDRKSTKHSQTETISELAERQHGVVATAQLYSLGLSETQVAGRVAKGWLHRIHRGVYAVGHRKLTREGFWIAAVLACGENAVLSHQAAGELWELRQSRGTERRSQPIDIAIRSGAARRTRPGLIIHRLQSLRVRETTIHKAIPVTTPARTLLDLATALPRRQLERAIDEAVRLRRCSENDVLTILEAHRGEAGSGALGKVLAQHRAGSTATRSELEERFLALCRTYSLPQPEVNVPLLDYVVDFYWPPASLIVEVDGHASHGTRRAFQADRDRDGHLAVSGYLVVRFTWFDVTRRAAVVADRIGRLLRARRITPRIDR
jgi:very-short-patch-repair endonuclease